MERASHCLGSEIRTLYFSCSFVFWWSIVEIWYCVKWGGSNFESKKETVFFASVAYVWILEITTRISIPNGNTAEWKCQTPCLSGASRGPSGVGFQLGPRRWGEAFSPFPSKIPLENGGWTDDGNGLSARLGGNCTTMLFKGCYFLHRNCSCCI